jgi:hypothetical protein
LDFVAHIVLASHPAALPASHLAIGGGIGSLLVHLFIWHLIWRFLFTVWRIHTFGPIIVGLVVVAVVALAVLRSSRGPGWWRRSRGGWMRHGPGDGPRDW